MYREIYRCIISLFTYLALYKYMYTCVYMYTHMHIYILQIFVRIFVYSKIGKWVCNTSTYFDIFFTCVHVCIDIIPSFSNLMQFMCLLCSWESVFVCALVCVRVRACVVCACANCSPWHTFTLPTHSNTLTHKKMRCKPRTGHLSIKFACMVLLAHM